MPRAQDILPALIDGKHMNIKTSSFFMAAVVIGIVLVHPVHAASDKTIGTISTPTAAKDVTVVNGYAYVAAGTSGVLVYDVSTPSAPTQVGSYAGTAGDAVRLEASGPSLFVANTTGLLILNISNPKSLTLSAAPTAASMGATTVDAVTVDDTYAYVGATAGGVQKVFVFDVSIASSPTLKSALTYTGSSTAMVVSGQYLYLAGGHDFTIVNKSTMTLVGSTTFNGGGFEGVQVFGSYAYLNDLGSGLVVISVATPAAPAVAADYHADLNGPRGGGIVVANNYAFMTSTNGGLVIYDITNGASPVYVDTFTTPALSRHVAMANNYAYVANDTSGVKILDVSKPDEVPPVVTPIGDPVVTVIPGKKYVDPGATATDNIDGSITPRITVTGKVDPNTVGTYVLTYEVTDRGGNVTKTTRTVIVPAQITTIKGSKGAYGITVGKKKVTVRPFGPNPRGAILARKAIVQKLSQPVYYFLQMDAQAGPQLVVMNYTGKVLSRAIVSGISKKGFRADTIADGVNVWLAVTPKNGGTTARVYTFTAKGLKLVSSFTISRTPAATVVKFLKLYTSVGNRYGIAAFVKGKASTVKFWKYSANKKKFLNDVSIPKSRVKISGETVKLI